MLLRILPAFYRTNVASHSAASSKIGKSSIISATWNSGSPWLSGSKNLSRTTFSNLPHRANRGRFCRDTHAIFPRIHLGIIREQHGLLVPDQHGLWAGEGEVGWDQANRHPNVMTVALGLLTPTLNNLIVETRISVFLSLKSCVIWCFFITLKSYHVLATSALPAEWAVNSPIGNGISSQRLQFSIRGEIA